MRRCTIGPASSRLGEGLAGRDVLVPSCSSDSCGGPGACTLTRSPVVRCFLRHIGAAGFRVQRAGSCFGGRMALDRRLSRVRTGVAAMGQDCNYQLDITKLGRKGGKKKSYKNVIIILSSSLQRFI
ncbi:unnamed protein product [Coregonus sp. 'balchen']|nr:unnamed protein product [Coregonus sp. 'balchen']